MESDRAVISINVSVSRQSGSLWRVWQGALSCRGELPKYLMFLGDPCKSPSSNINVQVVIGTLRNYPSLIRRLKNRRKAEEEGRNVLSSPQLHAATQTTLHPAPWSSPVSKRGAGSWAAAQWMIQITRADEFWGWAEVKGGRQAERASFKYTEGYSHKVADQLFSISRKQDGGSVCGGGGEA